MTAAPQHITFRPLEVEDFPRLTRWLAEPRVRAFVQKTEISLDQVIDKYGPRVRGEAPVICHLALHEGTPFGYLQSYRNADWPDWAKLIAHPDGISVDLFIGDPSYHGRGLGRAMLGGYLRQVAFPAFTDQQSAYIAHEDRNRAALGCSKAVGFVPLGPFVEDGLPMTLLRASRAGLSPQAA